MSDVDAKSVGAQVLQAYERYQRLAENGGFRSQLGKRLACPDDLRNTPAFYKLFPEMTWQNERDHELNRRWQARAAFFFPWCRHSAKAEGVGAQLAKAGISESQFLQVFRSEPPNDLIQLRRLFQQVDVAINWEKFGATLVYWGGERSKRELLEDFFLNLNSKGK